jgi:glycosyltransferase involved in cell wall biosynthesis
MKIPLVQTVHGLTIDFKNKLTLKYTSALGNVTILVSSALEQMIKQHEWIRRYSNFRVVHNGIDQSRLRSDKESVRSELNIPDDAFVIGMTGSFCTAKDHVTLCRAMIPVVSEIPQAHLLLAGRDLNGTSMKECKHLVMENGLEEKVHFLGHLDNISPVLNTLNCFVFSTLTDTFGLSVVEAMMLGIPCITSDIEAMKEVCENGRYALHFPTGNAEALAACIVTTFQNPSKAEEMACQAKVHAEEHFSIQAHLDRVRRVYAEACATDLKSVPIRPITT